MVYDAAIPQASNKISQSQVDLLNNMIALNSIFAVDHVTYNAGALNGTHTRVSFSSFPFAVPAPTGTNSVIFPNADIVSGLTQLFFKNATETWQLTGSPKSITANGFYVFPGGLQIKWGTIVPSFTFPPGGTVDDQFFFYPAGQFISAADAFPITTFAVFIQPIRNNTTVQNIYLIDQNPLDFNKSGFKLRTAVQWPDGFMYFAIGN